MKLLQEATKKIPKAEQEIRELLPLKVIEQRYDDFIKALVNTITLDQLIVIEAGLHSDVPQDMAGIAQLRKDVMDHLTQYGQAMQAEFTNTLANVMIPSGLLPNPRFYRNMQAPRWVNHVIRISLDGKQLAISFEMATRFAADPKYAGSHKYKSKKANSVKHALEIVDDLYHNFLIPETRKAGILPGSDHAA